MLIAAPPPPPPPDDRGVTVHGAPIFGVMWIASAVILCVLAIAYGALAQRVEPQPPPPADPVPTAYYPQYEPRLLELEREAIENAYKQQVVSLYLTWMKDSTGQPLRARRGVNQAKAAFVASMDALARREKTGQEMITRPPDWKP